MTHQLYVRSVPNCTGSCIKSNISQQPPNDFGASLTLLNSANITFDETFNTIRTQSDNCSCNKLTYSKSDPRLCNAVAGTWLQLDRPPLQNNIFSSTSSRGFGLTGETVLDNYGKNYRSYNDITAGQISYYVDSELDDVLFKPVFSKQASVISNVYKDPMDNVKPVYTRVANEIFNPLSGGTTLTDVNILGCAGPKVGCNVGEYSLSWIKDTQYQREDILSKQMQKHNGERYQPLRSLWSK